VHHTDDLQFERFARITFQSLGVIGESNLDNIIGEYRLAVAAYLLRLPTS
jgi:hypothetical protein